MAGASGGSPWFEVLRPPCAKACAEVGAADPAAALFYLARWCQKTSKDHEPDVSSLGRDEVSDAAGRIARNLHADGDTVDRLVDGDRSAWAEIRRQLLASARPRAREAAIEHAEEALQKIAVVLLTGTAPSRAAEQLAAGPDGPGNEYVFHSPFTHWARSVVINLIHDRERRAKKEREPPAVGPVRKAERLDASLLARARDALPDLVHAVRELPAVQRSVLVLSLSRQDLDEAVLARLRELAPDLFGPVASDRDIATRLGTTARLVAANRSAARRKLARRDPLWGFLLDVLLPHRSTRPLATPVGADRGRAGATASEAGDG